MPRYGERRVLPNGTVMFIDYNAAPRRHEKCVVCGRYADRLCDWKMPNGKDCDRPLCRECARRPPVEFGKPKTAEIDYCPEHHAMWQAQTRQSNRM